MISSEVYFYLDDIPKVELPCDCYDVNSKLIYSLCYHPIFRKVNGKYLSDHVVDQSRKNQIKLRINEGVKFWSDGSSLTPKDIYETLKYLLLNKKSCCSYLSFIVGVNEYLRGDEEIECVQINFDSSCFYANVYTLELYKEVLSSINFAPLKIIDGIIDKNIVSSGYNISNITAQKITLKNQESNFLPPKIIFILEKDISKQIKNINSGKLAYSGFTSMTGEYLTKNVNYYELPSSIQFRLVINEELHQKLSNKGYKSALLRLLSENLELKKFINLNDKYTDIPLTLYDNNRLLNLDDTKVRLVYPNYYPNSEIVQYMKKVMSNYGYEILPHPLGFNEYLRKFNDFDIILELIEPISKNLLDLWIEKIPFIESRYRSQYVKLLNQFINSKDDDLKMRYHHTIEKMIVKNSRIIEIGTFRQYYVKNNVLPNVCISDNGLIDIRRMFGGVYVESGKNISE